MERPETGERPTGLFLGPLAYVSITMGHKYLIEFDDEVWAWLEGQRLRTGTPVSELIRQGVERLRYEGIPCGLVLSGAVASGALFGFRLM